MARAVRHLRVVRGARDFVARLLGPLVVHHAERAVLLLDSISLFLALALLHGHDALTGKVFRSVVSLGDLVQRAAGLALRKRRLLIRKPLLVLLILLGLVIFQNLLGHSRNVLLANIIANLVLLVA